MGLSCLCALFVAIGGTRRRELNAASPKDEQPVLRVSTRLVQVNVVVETKDGNPVEGLTKNDFTLYDDGKPQDISFFSAQSNKALSGKAHPLPPGTFSNRLEQKAEVPSSVTVILLDGLNTHFEDQGFARKQIIKFLQQIQPKDHVAIYTLGSNVRVLHDFTTDSQALVAALHDYVGHESHEVKASEPGPEPITRTVITPSVPNSTGMAPIEVGLEDYLRQTQQQSADWYSMDRTLRTLDALKTIARRLAHLPGRKNLVWVSGSFPFTIGSGTANMENVVRGQRSFGPEIEQAERLLNDANMAIYPVDARGLVGTFGMNPNLSARRSLSARLPQDNPTIQGLGQLTPTHDVMQVIADETGGRAFYGTNDIMGSIRRALNDTRLTYMLGYYPANIKWDGQFREIKVRVHRSGVKVLSRRGYFAIERSHGGEEQQKQALLEAAADPLDATAIGITIQTDPSPQGNVLPVTVDIDTHGIALFQDQNRWTGSLDLLFAQMSPQGEMLNGLSQPVHLSLTDDEYHKFLKEGLSISGRLQLVAGVEKLKVIALDQSSLAVGSVTVPLDTSHETSQKYTP
jgi:VWFA-related protein